MKPRIPKQKLVLNKQTVVNLERLELKSAKGGLYTVFTCSLVGESCMYDRCDTMNIFACTYETWESEAC